MPQLEFSRVIDAPVDTVFDRATDVAAWPDLVDGIDSIQLLTDGPVGVGTRWRETRVIFGRPATEEMEITEFDRPSRYVVEARSHGAHYRTEYRFDAEAGGTRVDMQFVATPETTTARVMSVLMKPMMRSMSKLMEADMDSLKASIERS